MGRDFIKLKKVYIEITNNCNMNCSFCKKSLRNIQFMPPERFAHALDKIKPYTNYIYLHVLGEPLTHPDLGTILNICHEKGFIAKLTTNGSLISTRRTELENKPALVQINYSLHSLSEAAGGENTLSDIYNFIYATKNRICHVLRLWNFNGSDDEKGYMKISDNLFVQRDERFVWPETGGEEVFLSGKCAGLKHNLAVLCDGTVVPCCLAADGEVNLGNIFENTLEEILSSPRALAIRAGFACGKVVEPFCRTCGFAKRNFNKVL